MQVNEGFIFMTINVNYGYVPTIHKQSDIPGRTSRICYADNDSVPPEKRGKEISDEDYKKLQEQRLGAVKYFKAPKAETVKKYVTAFEEWFEKYVSKPHKYDLDRIKDNTDMALDFVDSFNNNPNTNNNSTRYDVRI